MEISIIAIKEYEWNLMPMYETQPIDEYFAGVSSALFVFPTQEKINISVCVNGIPILTVHGKWVCING